MPTLSLPRQKSRSPVIGTPEIDVCHPDEAQRQRRPLRANNYRVPYGTMSMPYRCERRHPLVHAREVQCRRLCTRGARQGRSLSLASVGGDKLDLGRPITVTGSSGGGGSASAHGRCDGPAASFEAGE